MLVQRSVWLALASLLLSGLARVPAAEAQAGCAFGPGFENLRREIPSTVGACLENERVDPATGDAEQRTAGGLLLRRGAGDWVAFTNGLTTWLIGPDGLVSRPGGERFGWEPASPPTLGVALPTLPALDGGAGLPDGLTAGSGLDPLVAIPLPGGGPDTAIQPVGPPRLTLSPELEDGFNLLTGLRGQGADFRTIAERSGLVIQLGSLPRDILGNFRPSAGLVTVNQRVAREDDRVVAAVLAHELTHARQAYGQSGPLSRDECVQREVEAFSAQVKVWDSFDRGSSRSDLERHFSQLLAFYKRDGEAGLRRLIELSENYQDECKL